ncbi:MAG TPA: hypothetical protein EYN18_02140 [Nitrospirales bacterium]|nr:hypothetical protein [Nitrospirales bacterium]
MAKRKPDQTITHRIELQEKERELLSHIVYLEGTTKAFNNVAEPIVKLMNDVTGMITVMSILAATGITGVGFVFLASEDLSIGTVVDQFLSQRQQAAVAQGLDIAAAPFESLPGPLGEIAEQYGIFGILRRIFFP